MKKTLLLFTFFTVFALSAQEDIFSYNYRNVPAEEMDAFIENEVVYWSGIHALLVKKKTNYRMGNAKALWWKSI